VNTWTWIIASAFATLAVAALYIRVRWKRAPAAFRAMTMLGVIFVVAGIAIGYSANHLLPAVSIRPPWKAASDSPPDPAITDGKVPASDVGKAIVLMDEKHSGDPMWASSGAFAETCDLELKLGDKLSPTCIGTYLARHAIGKDLDRSPKDAPVSLDDVAEMCDAGQIEKDWPLCVDAYAARHAKMK
jgi:hypothetical protein